MNFLGFYFHVGTQAVRSVFECLTEDFVLAD